MCITLKEFREVIFIDMFQNKMPQRCYFIIPDSDYTSYKYPFKIALQQRNNKETLWEYCAVSFLWITDNSCGWVGKGTEKRSDGVMAVTRIISNKNHLQKKNILSLEYSVEESCGFFFL